MSNALYPSLPGLTFECTRTVLAPPVQKRKTPSRREYRARDATVPLYAYSLKYEFLRASSAAQDLQTLVGFYNSMGGSFDTFLFLDPDDNTATDSAFGIGDGSTLSWQLLRTFGGFAEPVFDVVPNTQRLRIVDWQGDTPLFPLARTNYCLRSAGFATTWTANGATVTNDTTTAPDGTLTADTLTDDTGTGAHSRRQNIPLNPNQVVTFSAFLKAGTLTKAKLLLQRTDTTNKVSVNFDLSAGTVGVSNAAGTSSLSAYGIEPAGSMGSGWYRCYVSAQVDNVDGTNLLVEVSLMSADTVGVGYAGTGTGTIIAWGAQVERVAENGLGSLEPGRYLATVAATVTSTDYAFSSWYQSGVVTLASAPVAGAALRWSGQFYRRCKFSGDKLDTQKFSYQLFNANKVDFEAVLA